MPRLCSSPWVGLQHPLPSRRWSESAATHTGFNVLSIMYCSYESCPCQALVSASAYPLNPHSPRLQKPKRFRNPFWIGSSSCQDA